MHCPLLLSAANISRRAERHSNAQIEAAVSIETLLCPEDIESHQITSGCGAALVAAPATAVLLLHLLTYFNSLFVLIIIIFRFEHVWILRFINNKYY